MITDREVIKIIPLKKIRDIFFEKHPHVIKNLNLEEIDIEFKKQKYDPETATPIRLHKLNGEWCIQSGWKLVLGLIRNAGRHQKVKVLYSHTVTKHFRKALLYGRKKNNK
jgi:hypothetical protein